MPGPQPVPDLDFQGADTTYLTHGMHSFPARFPPQLVTWALRSFLDARPAVVLDPMCGSGTTLVEALLHGHVARGLDRDPLARLISTVKTTPLERSRIVSAATHLREAVTRDIVHYRRANGDRGRSRPLAAADPDATDILTATEVPTPDWDNLDYWFFDPVIDELALIRERIRRVEDDAHRRFFEVVFSSTLVTKGRSSLVNAHDLAHSRPHRVEPADPPDTLKRFTAELDRKLATIHEFTDEMTAVARRRGSVTASIIGDDARDIPLADESVDLIVTSPPYINALDYVRATKYALFWLRWSHDDYRAQTGEYIGTERIYQSEYETRVDRPTGSALADEYIEAIATKDVKLGGVVHKFTDDMHAVIQELFRVLDRGAHCIVVVGNSDIRDVRVDTHRVLNELAKEAGFVVERSIPRHLDRDRRQLPTDRGEMKDGMADEYVLQWYKETA